MKPSPGQLTRPCSKSASRWTSSWLSWPSWRSHGAFDQYTGWGAHNYYLYRHPATGKWTYIAWDLDVGFADDAFGTVDVLHSWNAAYPYPKAERPLLAGMLADPSLLARYRDEAGVILETYFHPDVIVPKLHGLYDQIREDLADDPFPAGRITVPGEADWDTTVASLEAFMWERYDLAAAELASPTETPPEPPWEQSDPMASLFLAPTS